MYKINLILGRDEWKWNEKRTQEAPLSKQASQQAPIKQSEEKDFQCLFCELQQFWNLFPREKDFLVFENV